MLRSQKLSLLLPTGEQLRHKLCRDEQHVEVLPYNLQIRRQVPNERLNLSAASKMVFYQTLLRILQTFPIFSTCRGMTWMLTICNLSFPIHVSQEPLKHLFLPKTLLLKAVFNISCISHVAAPRVRQMWMQMLCSFKLVTRNSWTVCNTQNNKHLLKRYTEDYDWKSP